MSPGATTLRVYATLKDRIMAGEFAPGEKLDPKRLAGDLLTSVSPVRDALHRLHGERLVESLKQEGFRQPLIVEPAIRDVYEWSNDLMHIVLRAASHVEPVILGNAPEPKGAYRLCVSECFMRIALRSPNHEHRLSVANLLDRMALYRPVEDRILFDAIQDVEAIDKAVTVGEWAAAGRALNKFHQRRIDIISNIAAALRPDPLQDR